MVIIDEESQVPLSHMTYYHSFVKGGASYGKDNLPVNHKERFGFSPDISGNGTFTDSLDHRWAEGSPSKKIAVQCDQGSGV